MQEIIENLAASFWKYFLSLNYEIYEWFTNSFRKYDANLTLIVEENLMNLRNGLVLKTSHFGQELLEFCISLWSQYLQLASAPLNFLKFESSYLCELGFC